MENFKLAVLYIVLLSAKIPFIFHNLYKNTIKELIFSDYFP